MIKKILLLIFLITSTNVYAKWQKVDYNDKMTRYADLKTIHKTKNKVTMSSLNNFYVVENVENMGLSLLSNIDRDEYDCKERTIRNLEMRWYSGNMGTGQLVYINKEPEKNSYKPGIGSIAESLLNVACK
jgi:hypothetical protein